MLLYTSLVGLAVVDGWINKKYIYFTTYRFLNICLNVNKCPTNIMDLIQTGAAGNLNTMGGVIMYTLSFEYHIQGIL